MVLGPLVAHRCVACLVSHVGNYSSIFSASVKNTPPELVNTLLEPEDGNFEDPDALLCNVGNWSDVDEDPIASQSQYAFHSKFDF